MKTIICGCGKLIYVDDDVQDLEGKHWQCINGNVGWMSYIGDYKTEWVPLANFIFNHYGVIYDHKDLNVHNNVRENLRVATKAQNAANSGPRITNKSGYKGVSWCKARSGWLACIVKDGKTKNLGVYPTKMLAAMAYNHAAINLFGEFAYVNDLTHDPDFVGGPVQP